MVLLGKVTGYAGAKGVFVTGDDWFMGAGFVVNLAQLASQVAASIFPIRLINNTIMWLLLHAMLLTEASGFVNACYPIMWFMDWLFSMKKDPFHGPANEVGSIDAAIEAEEASTTHSSKGAPIDVTHI